VDQTGTRSFRTETRALSLNRSDILIDITVPTLIRSAWAILVGAYTGMDDVVFGETLAGRNIDVPDVAEMAGPTFTTVPTRVQLDRDGRVVEFLRNMQRMASQVVPHQHLGLQHIRRLGPDCAAACDFQNLLVIQTSSSSPASLQQEMPQQHDHVVDWDFQESGSTASFFTHPLVVECTVTDTSVETAFHYDEKVLSQWHARCLGHQFAAVLQRLVDNSGNKNTSLADIHVISLEDQALIAKWNGTKCNEVDSCIHQLFLEQASARPQHTAISAWDAELTYGEVRDYAFRLASHLNRLGVGNETLVPVCLDRSAWSAVTIMGILLAGGAFVPLAPAHPLTRHQEILKSIKARLIVSSPEHAPRFSGIVGSCVSVDGDMLRRLPSQDQAPLAILTRPTNKAYVLFTSGSTGRPKGVVVAHRDFCSSSRAYADVTRMNSSSRVFHFSSLSFDAALMEVLTPLTLGASICVPTADDRLNNLGNTMARMRVTWAFLTPSVANLVNPESVPTLKTLVCGGEAMLAQTVSQWADFVQLVNAYGPTETCVIAAANPLVSTERDPSIIGRGTAAARLWIVEPREGCNDRLAPVGAVGELAVSGPLLARGYLDEPEKTARAFVDSPAWARTGLLTVASPPTRIYRTGVVVRYRSDGSLEFFGRRDGQVKVNGQRIELGEVESRLSADSHVQLGLVVQPKTGACRKKLVGVITLASAVDGASGTERVSAPGTGDCNPMSGSRDELAQARSQIVEVQNRLTDTLPHYMVPAVWIVLESLPTVVSGKLDRQKVLRWVEGLDDATYERIASSLGLNPAESSEDGSQVTELVKLLREIWARELGLPVECIKLNQPFLGLGKFSAGRKSLTHDD
jgi:amino acid adenylation domain-containing protein